MGKGAKKMNRNQKFLLVFIVLTIPAVIALYSIAKWAIWAIVFVILMQGLNFYYSTRKMLSDEKKEWDEKWGKTN